MPEFSRTVGVLSSCIPEVPLWMVQGVVPIGFALMALVALVQLACVALGLSLPRHERDAQRGSLMTFLLILSALIALLYLGMPMFAGMSVFSTAIMLATKGNLFRPWARSPSAMSTATC